MRVGPLIIAIALALVAGFVALQMIGKSEPEPAPVVAQTTSEPTPVSNVYIASQFVPIGTVLTPEMVTSQPWPSNLVGETFVTDAQSPDEIVGKVARSSFQSGEPISLTKLSAPGEGSFMAGSLPKGMRAVTINTDETLGVAGFVFPGDRVDILVTHQVPKWDRATQAIAQEQITEPLLMNIPVLAVDQIANAQEIAANSNQQDAAAPSTIHVARTVTLMVNPIDGEKLRLGEQVGKLSLALRSVEDHDTIDMAALLRTQHITQYPLDSVTNPGASGSEGGVRVIRGVAAESVAPITVPTSELTAVPMLASPMPVAATPASGPAVATPAPAAEAAPVATTPEQVSAPAPLPAPPATPAAEALQ
jgi:pilus assembly protein CpaB